MDEGHDHHDHRWHNFGPLLVGVLGIIVGAVIVATFHCIIMGCYRIERQTQQPLHRRQNARTRSNGQEDTPSNSGGHSIAGSSSSNSMTHLMAVRKYPKECKEAGGGTCAVCLTEFNEGDEVRVLPECAHTFHVECIDMWLFSHPNCPLCRACLVLPTPHVVVFLPDTGVV